MSSLLRILRVAAAILIVGCGKGDGGKTPAEPQPSPTLLAPTIEVFADVVQPNPFLGMLRGTGNAKYSNGANVADGYVWSVNDTARANGTVLQFPVPQPGTYKVCLSVKSLSTCTTVLLNAPPVTYSAKLEVIQTPSREFFPKSGVKLSCIGTASNGSLVLDGFIIRLNNVVVGNSPTVDTVLNPGSHTASCTARNSPEDLSTFTIALPQQISVRVFVTSPTGERTDIPMKVCAVDREGSGQNPDCVQASNSGFVTILTPRVLDTAMVLTATCRDTPCAVMPSATILRRADYSKTQTFNTSVSNWTIQAGQWSGRQIPISMTKAYTLASGGVLSFYLKSQMPDGAWVYGTSLWKNFPIMVGVDRENSDTTITDDEITLIKNSLPKWNNELGFEVFRFGVIGVDFTRGQFEDGSVFYTGGIGFRRLKSTLISNVYGVGDFEGTTGAIVTLSIDRLRDIFGETTVGHELVHAFGNVGHAPCINWIGIMTDCQNANPVQNPLFGNITPEEVAYIQVMYAVVNSQRIHGGYGVPQMDQGERRSLGLPIQTVNTGQSSTGFAGIRVGSIKPVTLFSFQH